MCGKFIVVVIELIHTITEKERIKPCDEKCSYSNRPMSTKAKKEYWLTKSMDKDRGFPCAFNMRFGYHTIDGNIFQFAKKAMFCEFKTMGMQKNGEPRKNGDSAYNAIVDAVMTSKEYVSNNVFSYVETKDEEADPEPPRRKPLLTGFDEKPLPTTGAMLRQYLAQYLIEEATTEEIGRLREFYKDELSKMRNDSEYNYDLWFTRFGVNKRKLKTFKFGKKTLENWMEEQRDALRRNFELVMGSLKDIRCADNKIRANAQQSLCTSFYEKDVWMTDVVAEMIQKIYKVKIMVVNNYKESSDYYQEFERQWPYVELVPDGKEEVVHEHFVVINCIEGNFYDAFVSRISKKGLFTWEEFSDSPTLGTLFKSFIQRQCMIREKVLMQNSGKKPAAAKSNVQKGETLSRCID